MQQRIRHGGGFTLAEVLVALAISLVVVAAATHLYRVVLRASVALRSVEQDYTAVQQLRLQAWFATSDQAASQAFQGQGELLRFVTRHSANHGDAAGQTLARYRYDAPSQRLLYREARLPPAWSNPEWLAQAERTLDEEAPDQVVLRGVDTVRFEYWRGGPNAGWVETWPPQTPPPVLLRLRFRRADGIREALLELAVPYSVAVGEE